MSEANAVDIAGKRVVFLVGAARSGTTWLQLMLAAPDAVVTNKETHLFSEYFVSLFESWERLKDEKLELGISTLVTEQEFFSLIRHFSDSILQRILSKKPSAHVILEKTPAHGMHWRQILSVYPDAYFLHIVRDPRAVVASMRAAHRDWARTHGWGSESVIDNCARWKESVNECRRIREGTGRFMEVRYEDILSDCAGYLQRIFEWVALNISSDACVQIAERHQIQNLRSRTLQGAAWDLTKDPQEFYRRGESDSWKRELSKTQIEIIEYMAGDLMKAYSYERSTEPRKLANALRVQANTVAAALEWRTNRIIRALLPQR